MVVKRLHASKTSLFIKLPLDYYEVWVLVYSILFLDDKYEN